MAPIAPTRANGGATILVEACFLVQIDLCKVGV